MMVPQSIFLNLLVLQIDAMSILYDFDDVSSFHLLCTPLLLSILKKRRTAKVSFSQTNQYLMY